MTTETIQALLDASDRMVEATPSAFHRYLFDMIDWRDRLICIEGARGTGKSTIMRQRMKEALPAGCKAVYMSYDDLWFAGNPFVDAVQWLYSHGYTHLFLDEVHQMPDWSFRIKNVNDRLKIYFGAAYGITIDSAPDEGTRVHIRMPKLREEGEREKK